MWFSYHLKLFTHLSLVIMRRCNFRLMLNTYGPWAAKVLWIGTPIETRGVCFYGHLLGPVTFTRPLLFSIYIFSNQAKYESSYRFHIFQAHSQILHSCYHNYILLNSAKNISKSLYKKIDANIVENNKNSHGCVIHVLHLTFIWLEKKNVGIEKVHIELKLHVLFFLDW